jgi:transcriptional regulator
MKRETDVWQGTLALMILTTLDTMGPQHGYGIARRIEQTSGDRITLNYGTLYPALLKLEQEGYVRAEWGTSDNNRKAKFYALTRAGRKRLAAHPRNGSARPPFSRNSCSQRKRRHEIAARVASAAGWPVPPSPLRGRFLGAAHIRPRPLHRRAGARRRHRRRGAPRRGARIRQRHRRHRRLARSARRADPWNGCSATLVFACRLLRRNKAWAGVGVVSLALGAGAGAAVFSTAATTLLKGLSVPQAGNLVALRWQGENKSLTSFVDYGFVEGGLTFNGEASFDQMRAGATMPYEAFTRLAAANRTLDALFAFAPGPPTNVIVDGHGDLASTQFVSGDFFAALRIPPAAGRPLLPADDRAGAERVAVISHAYWMRRFGGSPSIVGKQVRLNAVAFTIVGVSGAALPALVSGQGVSPDVALPLATEPAFQSGHRSTAAADELVAGRHGPAGTRAHGHAGRGQPRAGLPARHRRRGGRGS